MIFVECTPDLALVSLVAKAPRREIIHELKGKFEVCRLVSQRTNCLGMVDEDPGSIQPVCLEQMELTEEHTSLGIKVLAQKRKGNRIIVLCPDLEGWLIRTATSSAIELDRFGLPRDHNLLHRVINHRIVNLERLLASLLESRNEAVLTMKKLLTAKS
ncbi:MAG: hypothetical protein HYY29_02960 [Chloroflexi bacterium]|nr:hypothetical protein [Chloroflexota bacterium]